MTAKLVMTIFLLSFLFSVSFVSAASLLWITDSNGDEKTDFEPGEEVYIYGTGFLQDSIISIAITRPDGEIEYCDSVFCHERFVDGLQTSNPEGDVLYVYDLDGIQGEYLVEMSDGVNVAQIAFTDARNILNVTVDGGSSTTVLPSGSVLTAVTVLTNGVLFANDWRSTRYRIEGGSWVCVNTPDHTFSGTFTESFSITAPGTVGIYDLEVEVFQFNLCLGEGSNIFSLSDAIVVISNSVCGNGDTESPEQCDDGNTNNGDGCDSSCMIEKGWECNGKQSLCGEICGDGIIVGDEQCDDRNDNNGDGCSSSCQIEDGYSCKGEPSLCLADNPELKAACGLDMMLVMDSSGSISASELNIIKNAYKNFVDAVLPNTPSEVAVVDFDNTGTLILNYTDDVATIKAAIDSVGSGGATNWEDALEEAHDQFDNNLANQDLYIFASDGHPNRAGDAPIILPEPSAVLAAIQDANEIKSDGVRIETLGIGNPPDETNLKLISSNDAYHDSNFDELAAEIKALAETFCKANLTVEKTVDGVPAQNWEFFVDVLGGSSDPNNDITNGDGLVFFEIMIDNGTVLASVNETLQNNFAFAGASCVDANNNSIGVVGSGEVSQIEVEPLDEIFCTFENCHDQDNDSVCDDNDRCPDTPLNEEVDGIGCSHIQFCKRQAYCGDGCNLADWKYDEQDVENPHDCKTVIIPKEGTHILGCAAIEIQCTQ